MPLTTFDEQQPVLVKFTFNNAWGTVLHMIVDTVGYKLRLDALFAVNIDTIDHIVNVYLGRGGSSSVLGAVNVPATTMSNVQVPVDILAALGLTAQSGLVLGPLDQLTLGVAVIVGTGAVYVSGVGGTL